MAHDPIFVVARKLAVTFLWVFSLMTATNCRGASVGGGPKEKRRLRRLAPPPIPIRLA
jgi:hypothetical protein